MSLVSLIALLAAAPTAHASPISRALTAFQAHGDQFTTRAPRAGVDARLGDQGAHLRPIRGGQGLRVHLLQVDGVAVDPVAPPQSLPCAPVPLLDPAGDCIAAVQRDLGGVMEWWQAVDGGIQQGWVVADGGAELVLDVALEGALEVEVADAEAWVVDADGTAWTVSGIQAWDAHGQPLAVELSAGEAPGMRLRVDTGLATFPVTVDPVYAAAIAVLTTTDTDAYFGISVDGAGDLDGDGFDDLVVGGNRADDFVGKAWVFYGSVAGPAPTADLTLTPPETGQFGFHVAGLGDVDGDGFPELAVGAPFSDGRRGRVYVYRGGPAGLDPSPDIISGPVAGGYFGLAFDGGDVNGDGYADLVASSYCWSGCTGRVYVFEGGAAGLATTPSTTLDGPTPTAYYGQSVASGGDVDGDGIEDVVVGGYGADSGAGVVDVFLGATSGLQTTAVASVHGASGDYLGRAVALGGDLDGDGYDDLAYTLGVGMGTVHVAFGGAGGPDLAAPSVYTGGALGSALAISDDSDGDGVGELILGDASAGTVTVYAGMVGGVSSSPMSTLSGTGGAGYFGAALALAGDVDGDGAGDIVVGAPGTGVGGQVHVFRGYVDVDGDGLTADADCDDRDAAVGGPEVGFVDADGDGFGDPATTAEGCAGSAGFSLDATDCDDGDATVFPGAPEVAGDGVDQDCDGVDAEDADTGVADTGIADTGSADTGGASSGGDGSDAGSGLDTAAGSGGADKGTGCSALGSTPWGAGLGLWVSVLWVGGRRRVTESSEAQREL